MVSAQSVNANRWLLGALVLLLGSALLNATGLWSGFAWTTRATFLVLCVISLPTLSVREVCLMVAALALSAVVWVSQGGPHALFSALDLAAFFGAFIAALTVMRDVAARSRSILAVGRYLILQPAGSRFYATAFGGHILAVFLNFGAVSLMSPLIQESVKTAEGHPDKDLERRQLSALIRGFAWVLLWAPTTLSQAVLLTIFTEVTWVDIGPLGIGTALGLIVLGRMYDRFEWRGEPVPAATARPEVPWRAALTVGALCAVLIGATVIGGAVTGASVAQVLMCVAPSVTVLWFLAQAPPVSAVAAVQRMQGLAALLTPSAPSLARSAVALGLSGYIGRSLGQALPVDAMAQAVDFAAIPGWLFLAMLPVVITLGGQIALSPILLVVLLGEILSGFEALPTGQVQILFTLSFGWALSMTSSPNATATLVISATTRIPPTTLTWAWNLRYGLIAYACALPLFVVIA